MGGSGGDGAHAAEEVADVDLRPAGCRQGGAAAGVDLHGHNTRGGETRTNGERTSRGSGSELGWERGRRSRENRRQRPRGNPRRVDPIMLRCWAHAGPKASSLRATPVGASIWASTPKFGGFGQKNQLQQSL
jgi:hypothetical protein